MATLPFLLVATLFFLSCSQPRRVEPAAPVGWNKTEAGKFFTFYLPKSMHLVSEATCLECAWGSTYSDTQIRLDAEYTSWNEEYAPDDLAKRADYTKELATIDGHRSKIQGWCLQQPEDGYHYTGTCASMMLTQAS